VGTQIAKVLFMLFSPPPPSPSMPLQSNADLCLLNGLLQVNSVLDLSSQFVILCL
jgi:hypothetical protein